MVALQTIRGKTSRTMAPSDAPLSSPSMDLSRARVLGARAAVVLALLMGATLAATAWESLTLCLCIALVTALVVGAARPVGARVAVAAVHGSVARALALGVLGGLACLVVAAAGASVVGGVWGLVDAVSGRDLLLEYMAKPFVVVALFGSPFAVVLGAVHGLWVRARLQP